jgi:transglutaminase-like putative cysteine protease
MVIRRRRPFASVLFLNAALCLFAAPCLFAALEPSAAHAQGDPTSIRLFRSDTVVEADGRATETVRLEVAVRNDAAAQREAQQAFTFPEDIVTVTVVEAYTLKADGRRLDVPADAIRTQLAPGVPNVPIYGNLRQVVLVLPDVAGGDVVALTLRRTTIQPLFPGQFTATYLFAPALPWDDAAVTIDVPDGMTLRTEAFGPTGSVERGDGRTVHRWHWRAPAKAGGRSPIALLDRAPRIFASTFADWPAFSATYAALAGPQAAVTPRIRAIADEVTAGAADRREEAARLYAWVVRRVRWVAIHVGNGSWVPHAADTVLTNGFGDCKDQATLLIALLRARGIVAEPVLVHLGQTYVLSGPPTITAFDHMIVYLPEWDLYADTTSGGAFGMLPWALDGKPALHVNEAGAAPGRIPAVTAEAATTSLRTRATLGTDGVISGETVTEASGPFATDLRARGRTIMAQGAARAAAEQLRTLNATGTGTFVPPAADDLGPDHRIEGRFTLAARPELLEDDSFLMPTGLRLLPRPGDVLVGRLADRDIPATTPTPCHAGIQTEALSLALPPGFRPKRLPRPRTVDDDAFRFESRWSFEEGIVTVHRRFMSRVAAPLCEGVVRQRTAKLLDDVRRDLDTRITLEPAD